jgi:hypothetical protein
MDQSLAENMLLKSALSSLGTFETNVTHGTDVVATKTVLLYFLGLLQSVCGYYIPMSPLVLWWALGIGSFLFGLIYLQYLYTAHFFVDAQIATIISMATKEASLCQTRCYSVVAQDMSAFFFLLATHFFIYGRRRRNNPRSSIFTFRNTILVVAFFVYSCTIIISPTTKSIPIAIISILVGAILGILKVIFFRAVLHPAWEVLLTIIIPQKMSHHLY